MNNIQDTVSKYCPILLLIDGEILLTPFCSRYTIGTTYTARAPLCLRLLLLWTSSIPACCLRLGGGAAIFVRSRGRAPGVASGGPGPGGVVTRTL